MKPHSLALRVHSLAAVQGTQSKRLQMDDSCLRQESKE